MPDVAALAKDAMSATFVSGATATGVWAALLALAVHWIRQRPGMRKAQMEEDASLRHDLREDLDKLRAEHAEEKREFARLIEAFNLRFDALRTTYEQKLEHERDETTAMRHRLNNVEHSLEMLLVLIETNADNPDKIRESAVKVRQLRDRQREIERQESGRNRNARLTAVSTTVDTLVASGE